jgi:hypothetical protein
MCRGVARNFRHEPLFFNFTSPPLKTIDLGKLASAIGPVTRWITEPKGTSRYEMHQDVTLPGKRLEITLPANSVKTFAIENVTLP